MHWGRVEIPIYYGGEPKRPFAPANLNVIFRSPTVCQVSWLPPLSDVQVTDYKVPSSFLLLPSSATLPSSPPRALHPLPSSAQVTIRVLSTRNSEVRPDTVYSLRSPGNVYSQIVDNLHLDTVYNITIQAGSNGLYGPGVSEIVSTGPGSPNCPLAFSSLFPTPWLASSLARSFGFSTHQRSTLYENSFTFKMNLNLSGGNIFSSTCKLLR